MKIIFATGNGGKFREVEKIFDDTNVELISLKELENPPEVVEDGDTFEYNSIKKAKEIFEKYQIPTIADDSGLAIHQLDGRPGVYSARYAGENCSYDDNNKKVISELAALPEPHLGKFVCFAVYYDEESVIKAQGELRGKIIDSPAGAGGFGYDPIFIPDGFQKTLAQLNIQQKNEISHRAEAFNLLKKIIIKEGKIK